MSNIATLSYEIESTNQIQLILITTIITKSITDLPSNYVIEIN